MRICADCGQEFDLENEGGFIWDELVFCEDCDPEQCYCEQCYKE